MNSRRAILALVAVILCVTGSSAQSPGQEGPAERPEPIWEREFEEAIRAVGVDEKCFARSGGDITRCLKWIMFSDKLHWFGRGGEVLPRPARGWTNPSRVSPSGNWVAVQVNNSGYFRDWRRCRLMSGYRLTVYTWDGIAYWSTRRPAHPGVWLGDDGSAAVAVAYGDCEYVIDNVVFRGTRSLRSRRFDFGWKPYLGAAFSNGYYAACIGRDGDRRDRFEIHFFGKGGRFRWKRRFALNERIAFEHGDTAYGFRDMSMSRDGHVLLALNRVSPGAFFDYKILILDSMGVQQDTFSLTLTGGPSFPRGEGSLVFVRTGGCMIGDYLGGSSFVCYDLETMRKRFVLRGGRNCYFGVSDVDVEHGLVAVAVCREPEGVHDVVRLHNLEGAELLEFPAETPEARFAWVRLLDGALLVAEGNKLKLFETDVE